VTEMGFVEVDFLPVDIDFAVALGVAMDKIR
jgi:hypothetical protein